MYTYQMHHQWLNETSTNLPVSVLPCAADPPYDLVAVGFVQSLRPGQNDGLQTASVSSVSCESMDTSKYILVSCIADTIVVPFYFVQ